MPDPLDDYVPEPTSGCWLWTGETSDPRGYGRLIRHGQRLYAHRAMFAAVHGLLPTGAVVCHHCDTPACVNPAHLFLGSHADNARDRTLKGRPHGSQRLSPLEVWALRAIHASGLFSHAALARGFGISRPHVSYIVRRLKHRLAPASFTPTRYMGSDPPPDPRP